jgi:hypothetical protein
VRAIVGAAVDVEAITARFGSAHIASEASYAIAAHAALDRRIGKRPCAGSVFTDPRGGSAATIDS